MVIRYPVENVQICGNDDEVSLLYFFMVFFSIAATMPNLSEPKKRKRTGVFEFKR